MDNIPKTPMKKRPAESGHTSVEDTDDDGYDTDSTEIASPYDIDKQRVWEREYKRERLDKQNQEYERRQLMPQQPISPTVIVDRKTDNPFYIKNAEGQLETVTSANIRNGNTFYNKDGEQIVPEFLFFDNEKGGKSRRRRRKTRRIRKKSRKSIRKNKKTTRNRKHK